MVTLHKICCVPLTIPIASDSIPPGINNCYCQPQKQIRDMYFLCNRVNLIMWVRIIYDNI